MKQIRTGRDIRLFFEHHDNTTRLSFVIFLEISRTVVTAAVNELETGQHTYHAK